VATFHVLPPRPLFGSQCAKFLERWLPGLNWAEADRTALAEAMIVGPGVRADGFVIFREELPEGADLSQTLIDCFGAEAGDEVVEVTLDGSRRWRLAG
jgi:hypothetical protein